MDVIENHAGMVEGQPFLCLRVGVCAVGVISLVKSCWQTLSVVQSYTVFGHRPKRAQAHIMMSQTYSLFVSVILKDVLSHSTSFVLKNTHPHCSTSEHGRHDVFQT